MTALEEHWKKKKKKNAKVKEPEVSPSKNVPDPKNK